MLIFFVTFVVHVQSLGSLARSFLWIVALLMRSFNNKLRIFLAWCFFLPPTIEKNMLNQIKTMILMYAWSKRVKNHDFYICRLFLWQQVSPLQFGTHLKYTLCILVVRLYLVVFLLQSISLISPIVGLCKYHIGFISPMLGSEHAPNLVFIQI